MGPRDEDNGIGDPTRFPVADLERLYHGDNADEPRIRGEDLNRMLGTKRYKSNAWYVVTNEGVQKV